MPELTAAQIDQLMERRGTLSHVLLWLSARNRETGDIETIGLWTGDDHQVIMIGGEERLYYGAGAVIDPGILRAAAGLEVRYHRVTVPPILDEVRKALRGYDPRRAPVELHVCPMDIDSGAPLGPPVRVFKGTIEEAPEKRGPDGTPASREIVMASPARALTIGVPILKSQAALELRDPTDRGREHTDTVADRTIPWGEITQYPTPPGASGGSAGGTIHDFNRR